MRTALRRYRRNALLIFAGGWVLLAGFAISAVRVEDAGARLERTGARVPGEVVGVDPGFRTPGSIEVAFTYLDRPRREVIHLDSDSPDYEIGQPVEVLVDPQDTGHVSVPGETNQSPVTVLPMIAALIGGVILVVTGGRSLVRVRRQRRLLAAEPWRRTPARYHAVPRGRGALRGVVLIEEDGKRRIFTISDTLRSRLRRAGLRDRHDVELVGDAGGRVVVRAVGSTTILSAKRPRRMGARRRWLRQAFPDLRR